MYGKCHRRLVEVYVVMTRRVVLAWVARMDWCNKVQVGSGNRRHRRWCWNIWLDRRNLRMGSGTGAEVVRKRRPPLA
jgi:hypothetical protein